MRFEGRVALVTGAGNGLGRAHAKLLGERGAKVLVNDIGVDPGGSGRSGEAADQVVAEIEEAGGVAAASYDSVEEGERIVECALDRFGSVDIVINNAGNLRDRAFHNMTQAEWGEVYDVHLLGGYRVTHAAWPHLREQRYGRVVFTSSGSGLYGNFGQANYAAAKLGLYGLSQTLAIEGRSRNILVNAVAPAAGSRLSASIWPQEVQDALKPEYVSPLVVYLCHETCPVSGALFEVGAGWLSRMRWQRSEGVSFAPDAAHAPEDVADNWERINDFTVADNPSSIADAYEPLMRNLPEDVRQMWLELTAARGQRGG
jgi:3-hydroxyacyl-CoA dehydrogenase/3a,7a,12a-trihydroxy-5b-cholest-24-enoyl-CoA hydratase